MNEYQQFIHKSRYSRYIDKLQRREHWEETVQRYVDFLTGHVEKKHSYKVPQELKDRIYKFIVDQKVMPSMRLLMTAGPAAERQNMAGFNCSYLPIDDTKSFDELMYILLCGTGVGFSVESTYTNQLPEVPDQLYKSETTIVVSDSKEGWAKSLRQLISLLYAGEIPQFDFSKVRPAGARLKTFGGRASGPGPLAELFSFVINVFKKAVGRKLLAIECHDVCCKIAEVVVVGGVRRSALISISDLADDRMAHAKSGAWWEGNVQRSLANNSACYNTKPSMSEFMSEWQSLYNSKSGERGIFNREASIKQAAKNGRRKINHAFGTNPCSEIILRPYEVCNLTEVIVREDDDIMSLADNVEIATILGTFQSTLTEFPYLRKIWQKNAEEERLLGVSFTGIFDNKIMSTWNFDLDSDTNLENILGGLKNHAIQTNKKYAELLGINQSTAITCVKPSGTVSQLCLTASGLHARHSQYYIRTVRQDVKDPLTTFLKNIGVPWEPCVNRPDSTVVFSFPIKSPDGIKTRDSVDVIDHLNLWLTYQRFWCEHKPSVTIYVKEDEWMKVGAWVWDHFDEVTGISFLPFDGGQYKQAPYQSLTKEEYEIALAKMPQSINWEEFLEYDDNVEGVQQLSCTAGVCEI